MPMGPICTGMVGTPIGDKVGYRAGHEVGNQVAGLTSCLGFAALGRWGTLKPRHGPLTEPITLIRDLDCIRAGGTYFAVIKADWAAPHPPRHPAVQSDNPEFEATTKGPQAAYLLGVSLYAVALNPVSASAA